MKLKLGVSLTASPAGSFEQRLVKDSFFLQAAFANINIGKGRSINYVGPLMEIQVPEWRFHIVADGPPEQLKKVGPVIPGAWVHPNVTSLDTRIEGLLLVDTGASGAMIDESTACRLAIPTVGAGEVHGAHGYGNLHRYLAKLLLPVCETSGKQVLFGIPIECYGMPQLLEKYREQGLNVVGVLGRLFLQFCNLEINGVTGQVRIEVDDAVRYPRP